MAPLRRLWESIELEIIKVAGQQVEVILLIDEIHTLAGTGAGGGSTMDAPGKAAR